MTDRYRTLTVTFDQDIREDDLEAWITAIYLMDHVSDVTPGGVDNMELHVAKSEIYDAVRQSIEDANSFQRRRGNR